MVISLLRKSFSDRMARCKGIRVSTPNNLISCKAAINLEIDSSLVGAQTINLASKLSNEAGISYPVCA